jgi:hypothetical protein
MSLINTGLPNGGVTTYYKFFYDSSLGGPGGIEPARTTQLMQNCDADFERMQNWFAGVTFPFSTPMEVDVDNSSSGGASWGPPVQLDDATDDANYLRMLLIAEVTEMFMKGQDKGWFPGDTTPGGDEGSNGEGLSRFLAEQFLIETGIGISLFPGWGYTATSWLSSTSPTQPDWINNVDPDGDTNYVEIGCNILFLYYLFVNLNFSIDSIIAAAAPNPAGVYSNLTGDDGNPFPFFQTLVNAYPGPAGLSTGVNLDNPFPVGLTSIWVEKSTFGLNEVQDVITQHSGTFSAALWVVIEGFSKNSFNALGISVNLNGSLTTATGVKIAPSATAVVDYENPALPNAPQRIRVPYDITFTTAATNPSTGIFPAAGNPPAEFDLHADLQAGGQTVSASDSYAAFEFIAGADPYFTNVDPAQGNVFYLSQDLRVFSSTAGPHTVPVSGGPTFGTDSVSGAFSYIQALLAYLNGNSKYTSGAADPFSTVLPAQSGAFQGDSSVTPLVGSANNYNFAVARVRLRGSSGSIAQAESVKVFFRLFVSQSPDTDYIPSTTYASTLDAAALPAAPLVGAGDTTIPFFATGNLTTNTDYASGGINNQNIEIASGDTAWYYYGCFINVYDPAYTIGGRQVQQYLAGTHHCLVAQIACDSAPILLSSYVTPSPENSDKLAQRNLQVTTSDNPGGPSAHRIPQTFDIRPSKPVTSATNRLSALPDELMIDWGNVPVGSVASIYWPQVQATDVLNLADELYSYHALATADTNTIQCTVTKGVTYVPIPAGTGENYAGLLTIDLPTTVKAGQEFTVVVRRVQTTHLAQPPAPTPPQQPRMRSKVHAAVFGPESGAFTETEVKANPPADRDKARVWRFVTGAFQVTIPVETAKTMLPPEENTLAILKWRLENMDPANRWYPVLQRYIAYIAGRVDGLGGNASQIPPSLSGAPIIVIEKPKPCRETARFIGKVVEVTYDCFGDFCGFILSDCCEFHEFTTRERGLSEIIVRALRERLRLAVIVGASARILKVLVVE